MFAVPGWAVSASSLVQEKAKSKKSSTRHDTIDSNKLSKKRKHSDELAGTETTDFANDRASSRNDSKSKRVKETETNTEYNQQDGRRKSRDRKPNKHEDSRPAHHEPSISSLETPEIEHVEFEVKKEKGTKSSKKNRSKSEVQADGLDTSDTVSKTLASLLSVPSVKLTPLQAKMRSKLTSARFRHLNETLYTTSSSDALNLFNTSPELFSEYHAGFAQQVKESWPQNPVEEYVKIIRARGIASEGRQGLSPLPRRKTGSCTIADLGCGDAPLARGCQSVVKKFTLKFHNYDLHSPNTFVTKADISNLPLRDGEADIAVFCLSLMGTNWIGFVEEAWRILRGDGKGEVWVAEVKSRFGRVTRGRVVENSVGKRRKVQKSKNLKGDDYEEFIEDDKSTEVQDDETDISAFVKVFTRRGFQLKEGSVNKRNKMFVSMMFIKTGIPTAGKHKGLRWTGREYQKQQEGKMRFVSGQKEVEEITPEEEAKVLKPCVYKTR